MKKSERIILWSVVKYFIVHPLPLIHKFLRRFFLKILA
jgi:hypothetical protein